MNIPEDLQYTVEHEWVKRLEEGRVRIGITDYAQDQLGDVVFVELPQIGKSVAGGELMAEIESTKSVGEVYAPFNGVVVGRNESVAEHPGLVNTSPYVDGWLVDIELDGEIAEGVLLDADTYREIIA